MNNLKVFMLLAGMVALFGVVGGMLGGQNGMLLALVVAAAMSGFMYFNFGKMALRAYRAQVVTREQAPEIHEIVDRLRQRAGLPMPQVAIAPHEQPNAFATGRSPEHAVVCVTQGLLQLVDRDEIEADATGAEISGKPLALASALGKLQMAAKRIPMAVSPTIAPLAQVNPLSAFRGGIASLFSTHPRPRSVSPGSSPWREAGQPRASSRHVAVFEVISGHLHQLGAER